MVKFWQWWVKQVLAGIFAAVFMLFSYPLSALESPTPENLKAFFDAYIPNMLEEDNFPGGVITVASKNEVLFSGGYGFADLEKQLKADPDNTLFQPGSISKVLTWTAVMQLVEQGKLDLYADVNSYLHDFKIPDAFGKPVTLWNLLTHTAGFEDSYLGFFFSPDADTTSLRRGLFLEEHMPARIRKPGEMITYANYTAALAGYIVETMTGQTFEDYIEQNIFRPLGMNHSTFREPVPSSIGAQTASGYFYTDKGFEKAPNTFFHNLAPVGALSSTAHDMGRFLTAFLNGGQGEYGAILKPETVTMMLSRQKANDERLNGVGLGIFEIDFNGQTFFGHRGSTFFFNSYLVLFPEQSLGLFVSFNSTTTPDVFTDLIQAFVDRFIENPVTSVQSNILSADFGAITGKYRRTRQSYTKIDRLYEFAADITVKDAGNGRLHVNMPRFEAEWTEKEPGLFVNSESGQSIGFFRNETDGRLYLSRSTHPHMAYYKLKWFERTDVHIGLIALCLAVYIWAIFLFLRTRKTMPVNGAFVRMMGFGAISGFINILFLVGFSIFMLSIKIIDLFYSIPLALFVLLALPLISLAFIACCLFSLPATIKEKTWTWKHALFQTGYFATTAAFFWALDYWNLLGYRFG